MAADKKEGEEAEAAAEWELNSTVEAQMRRLSFFGRPAQKFRLVMRERQVTTPLLYGLRGYNPVQGDRSDFTNGDV